MNDFRKVRRITALDRVKNILRIAAGCIVLLFGISWVYEWGTLWYDYQYTGKLFYVMLPDWLLWLEIFTGLALIVLSFLVLRKKVRAGIGLLAIAAVFLLSYYMVRQLMGAS